MDKIVRNHYFLRHSFLEVNEFPINTLTKLYKLSYTRTNLYDKYPYLDEKLNSIIITNEKLKMNKSSKVISMIRAIILS